MFLLTFVVALKGFIARTFCPNSLKNLALYVIKQVIGSALRQFRIDFSCIFKIWQNCQFRKTL